MENCPFCGKPKNWGSHWDCVFQMMADWVKATGQQKKTEDPPPVNDEKKTPWERKEDDPPVTE